ncbi:serine hydrolase [Salinimicrobium sp. MT39]|uniref:Serine hydrolase n=1 Tax=Salinimicrobium profundisediminis TaxID=2994553 RepID=A0A9X3CX09_9FLAO|nr:serine hydrolase domain-containing protein [Salinimicrobium profundisediminis]MCX2838083.1 serine hydrolase [Salinimicrobium profundisediminis]
MKKLFTVLALVCSLFAAAQDFDRQKMDSLFTVVEKNDRGMGSFAIHKQGEPVYTNTIGYSDISKGTKANALTKYRIGSISKTFTAAMILQLVEEGKLSLDTQLSKFYPGIPNSESISIEDLLRHQSGLFNFTNEDAYLNYMEQPKSKEELLAIFKAQEPVFAPGEKNDYSNTNYVLLSFILEDLDGKSYAEILKNRIAQPLNLENTYYGRKIDSGNAEAYSYQKKKDWQPATETDLSIPLGAGGVVSTPTDLNLFFTALFDGKVLKSDTFEKMKTLKNGFGMGLFSFPFNEKTFYGHTGGIDGFNSMSMYYPEGDLAVSYISNGTVLSPNDIMIGALSIFWNLDYSLPSFEPAIEVSQEKLEQYTGTYGSETFPLEVKIFIEDETLMGQATGQPTFPLEAYEENKFQFTRAGLKLEFNPEANKLTLLQGGGAYELTRK